MNFKFSSVLLLSIMLCSSHVAAFDLSAKTILTSYEKSTDLKMISKVLDKYALGDLNRLEKTILSKQLQGSKVDFGPLHKVIKEKRHNIYKRFSYFLPPLLGACVVSGLVPRKSTTGWHNTLGDGAAFATVVQLPTALAYIIAWTSESWISY